MIGGQGRFLALTREHASMRDVVEVYQRYGKVREEVEGNRELLRDSDPELREMAKAELPVLEEELDRLEQELQLLLLPRDPRDDKNVILEVRAGTGGEEAVV